jgi:predicted transposase YbfD/YdcC
MAKKSAKVQDHFATLTDPRRRPPVYPLINVVTIAICAVICGADDFVAIAKFGKARREWFARFLDLKDGIPSHDRFNAIFAAINPAEFEKCLLSWITVLHEISGGQVIAIDGKTLRRSYDTASGKAALHMVSAWATANSISLGQVATDAKSNEITAIPKLLEIIDVSGALVTIDAMGCQTKIAQKILDGKGNYVLHVKENQPTLYQAIQDHFSNCLEHDFAGMTYRSYQTEGKGHGREETRSYYLYRVPADLPDAARWPGLKAIGVVISITQRDGKECTDVRYYILSRYLSARRFAGAVRGHWGIENRLHGRRDVTLGEDSCQVRSGTAPEVLAALRNAVVHLLEGVDSVSTAAALRHFAIVPHEAFALLTNSAPPDN